MKNVLSIVFLLYACIALDAQEKLPMFSIFKENYLTTGFPLNTEPDFDTNDVAFQVSMRFNVAQDIHEKDWDVFAGFTEMSIWDAYKPSNPFRSSIYSAGLYIYHPLVRRDGDVVSDILFGIEHRSNGYDSYLSRDLNYLFCTFTRTFGYHFTLQATGRFGIASIGNESSLEMYDRYQGYVNIAMMYSTRDRRLMISSSVTPLFGDIPCNVSAELAYRPIRDYDWFYLTARYHYGYDENQLDCAMPDVFLKQMLRFGLSIQPGLLSHKLFF